MCILCCKNCFLSVGIWQRDSGDCQWVLLPQELLLDFYLTAQGNLGVWG